MNYLNPQNAVMIRTVQHGISLLAIVFFASCKNTANFSKIHAPTCIKNNIDYLEYCNANFSQKFEYNSVLSSFAGNHQKAIQLAYKSIRTSNNIDENIDENIIVELKKQMTSKKLSKESKLEIQQYINWIEWSENVDTFFLNYEVKNAKKFILSKANRHHYLLINEAHYSGQHRAFTTELLEPLWNKGYRYLALEALSNADANINARGYPTDDSGYYIKESTFGNMIRKAKELGYTLITYETQSNFEGTLRDADQAINIYNQTLKFDKVGKVVVHAGYSHISEVGDENYKPMANHLKSLIGEEILTVDQQTMTERTDSTKTSHYYMYALNHHKIEEATVFVNMSGESLVDPVNSSGIDIQVYHPKTVYIHGRPHWLKNDSNEYYQLPKDYMEYEGCLIQIKKTEENQDAIPVDRFIVGKQSKAIIVDKGQYNIELFDCEGKIIAEGNVVIEN